MLTILENLGEDVFKFKGVDFKVLSSDGFEEIVELSVSLLPFFFLLFIMGELEE